jgi:hypothetical protein
VGRELGEHRAAVGAARIAALGEQGEIAAGGHRRDAETLLESGDAEAALGAQQLQDQAPALGGHDGLLLVRDPGHRDRFP